MGDVDVLSLVIKTCVRYAQRHAYRRHQFYARPVVEHENSWRLSEPCTVLHRVRRQASCPYIACVVAVFSLQHDSPPAHRPDDGGDMIGTERTATDQGGISDALYVCSLESKYNLYACCLTYCLYIIIIIIYILYILLL